MSSVCNTRNIFPYSQHYCVTMSTSNELGSVDVTIITLR